MRIFSALACSLFCLPAVLASDGSDTGSKKRDGKAPLAARLGDPLPAEALARLGALRWRHEDTVLFAGFTTDGKRLVTAGRDRTIRLWDRDTGEEVRRFPGGGALCLSGDGKVLAAARDNGLIQLWDLDSGKELGKIKTQATIVGLALSPSGDVVAARGPQQGIVVWDSKSGKELQRVKGKKADGAIILFFGGGPTDGSPASMVFSHDGKTIIASQPEEENGSPCISLKWWDVGSGKQVRRVTKPRPKGADQPPPLALSRDRKSLAVATGQQVHVCDADSGKDICTLEGNAQGTTALAFSPDGKRLACQAGRAIRVWELAKQETVARIDVPRRAAPRSGFRGLGGMMMLTMPFGGVVPGISFSPDGKILAGGGADNVVGLWQVNNGARLSGSDGHTAGVLVLGASADGKRVASLGGDGMVRLWNAASGKQEGELRVPQGTAAATLSADGRTLVTAEQNQIHFWDIAGGKELAKFPTPVGGVTGLALSPTGKLFVCATRRGNALSFHDAASGKELGRIALAPEDKGPQRIIIGGGANGSTMALTFSGDGRVLAYAGPDGALTVCDVPARKEIIRVPPSQPGIVGLALSADGRTVACELADRTVVLREAVTGQERARFRPDGETSNDGGNSPFSLVLDGLGGLDLAAMGWSGASSSLALSPDGRLLAARRDRTIRLLDIASGKELAALRGHQGNVLAMSFAANGKRLLSASQDTTSLIWDLSKARKQIKPAGELKHDELESLWHDLAAKDAARAFRSLHRLAAAPDQALPLFKERLRPMKAADPEAVRGWLADLASERFAVRQKASRELEKLADLATSALRKALGQSPSEEARRRMEQLLTLAERRLSPDQLRYLRALEALELVASPAARQIAEALAAGTPEARLTMDARQTCERMGR